LGNASLTDIADATKGATKRVAKLPNAIVIIDHK
jgi:hypothetical protein